MSKKNIKIGLALGSGGWRGLAHIGVIKALLKHNIPIDFIAGCSTGSMIGGYYGATQDIDLVEKTFLQLDRQELFQVFLDPVCRDGLFRGNKVIELFEKYAKGVLIENMDIPFCALAADLYSGEAVKINSGKLSLAIRASSSVPFLFQPVKTQGKKLIDGAVISPIPVQVCKEMGADFVIAVNLSTNYFPVKGEITGGLQIALKSTHFMLRRLANEDCKLADISICPNIEEPQQYQLIRKFIGNPQIIEAGEKATEEKIKIIKNQLNNH